MLTVGEIVVLALVGYALWRVIVIAWKLDVVDDKEQK